ncbi:hypothetical protein PG985_002319 [Apiospora marii]|uniref:uncharacterized protein n=1 Tax=Apiospora marii TaxID=335849 RepID=UPI0031310025
MGSFVFKWEHPASEVYVTGTFDGWKKTEKLDKVGNHFEKLVQLEDVSQKIDYKSETGTLGTYAAVWRRQQDVVSPASEACQANEFRVSKLTRLVRELSFVVDGEWTTDHTAPKETDASGNENNVLTTDRIIKEAPASTSMMSSAAPESTTAALAGNAPLENKKEGSTESIPGTFPETPAVDSGNQEFKVNPMPAVPGAVNPVQLAPGEKIPDHLASGSTATNNVDLDPKSYMTPDEVAAAAFLSSAAPASTTAALAAEAPLENPLEVNKVPAVVKESQEKAHVAPEASANPAEVKEKANLEEELLEKVKEAPSTSEGTAGEGTDKTENTVTAEEAAASVAAAATALGGAALAGAIAAKDVAAEKATAAAATAQVSATEAATQLPDSVKEMLPEPAQSAIASKEQEQTIPKEQTIQEVSPSVPVEVKQSIAESGESPEAAASTLAVAEKKVMEAELLKEVEPTETAAEASTEKAAEAPKPSQTEVSDKAAIVVPVFEEPEQATKPEVVKVTDSALENTAAESAAPAPVVPAATEASPAAAANGAAAASAIDPTTEAKPATEVPSAEATTTEPSTKEPAAKEPAAEESAAKEPAATEATTTEPAATESAANTESTSTKAAEGKTSEDKTAESTNGSADKKKKNRFSTFFQKLKPGKKST